jgi:hypothetical protein
MVPGEPPPQIGSEARPELSEAELLAEEARELPYRAVSPINTNFVLPLSAAMAAGMLSDDAAAEADAAGPGAIDHGRPVAGHQSPEG